MTKRNAAAIMDSLISALRAQFGNDIDVTPTGTARKILEAGLMLPLVETDASLDELHRQMFFESATSDNLDKIVEPIGFQRRPAKRASGVVNVALGGALSTPPEASPWIPAGGAVFVDTAGRKYENIADVNVDGTNALSIPVRAVDLGVSGNISANAIIDVQFTTTPVSQRWATNVVSFTNDAPFSGGRDRETDRLFRQRIRNSNASKPQSSLNGIITIVEELGDDVIATGIENDTDVGGTENKVFDSNGAGTQSEALSVGATSKIAMRVPAGLARRFIQHFNTKVTHGASAPTFKVSINKSETGLPGVIVYEHVMTSHYSPASGQVVGGSFHQGFYPDPALDLWVVFEITAGNATFDGDATGTLGDVKVWNGSAWVNSALRRLNLELIGGVPPHAFRLFISGGDANAIAEAIGTAKPAGIATDGLTVGTYTDNSGRPRSIYFDRPIITPVKMTITVTQTPAFEGTADALRDIIIEYVGGTDTKGVIHEGLLVNQKVVRNEIISRILEDANIVGLEDVTALTIGRKSGAEFTANLTPTDGEEFTVESPADIVVTINVAE